MRFDIATKRDKDGWVEDDCLFHLYLSLWNNSSGTIKLKFLKKTIEIDVKHFSPFDKQPFYFKRFNNKSNFNSENSYNYDYYEGFIPIKFKCEGIRISIYKLKPKV